MCLGSVRQGPVRCLLGVAALVKQSTSSVRLLLRIVVLQSPSRASAGHVNVARGVSSSFGMPFHVCTISIQFPVPVLHLCHHDCVGLLCMRSTGMIMGRPLRICAALKASVRIGELSVRIVVPIPMKKLFRCQQMSRAHSRPHTHPKVADDPSMYCPSVLIMPFGPGPYLIMFVAPKMNPMISPTAGYCQYAVEIDMESGKDSLPPIMAPIFALSKVEGPDIPPRNSLAKTQHAVLIYYCEPAAATGGILYLDYVSGEGTNQGRTSTKHLRP